MRWLVAGVLAMAVIGTAHSGGAQMRLSLEDRADPNPRQVALGMQVFGACLGLAISWSQHPTAAIR